MRSFQRDVILLILELYNKDLIMFFIFFRSKSHESVEKSNTIQKVTHETEVLRKQNEHLKALNENLTTENR